MGNGAGGSRCEQEKRQVNVLIAIVMIAAAFVVGVFLVGVVVTRFYRKVPQSQALIISRPRHIEVTFTGALVKPVVDRAEMMDIGVKVIEIQKAGNDGLICKDNIRACLLYTSPSPRD